MKDTYANNPTENRYISHYRQGNAHRWQSCAAAVHVVTRGDTSKVAAQLAISRAAVRAHAAAGMAYRILRTWAGQQGKRKVKRLHEIRTTLTYSHFSIAGRMMAAHDIPLPDLFDALDTAATENAPVDDLARFLQGEYADAPDDAYWKPTLIQAMKALDNLLDNYNTPAQARDDIKTVKNILAKYL